MQKAKATYAGAVAYGEGFELWTCDRILNAREPLAVFIWKGRRWRADTKKRTTIAELKAEGWKQKGK